MAKTASVGIRIEPELKAAAEKAAKDDDRTLAAWIERVMKKELESTGYLKEKKK